jgi:hypothetical protein
VCGSTLGDRFGGAPDHVRGASQTFSLIENLSGRDGMADRRYVCFRVQRSGRDAKE